MMRLRGQKSICNKIFRIFLWEKVLQSLEQVIKVIKEKFHPNIQYNRGEVFCFIPLKHAFILVAIVTLLLKTILEQNL